MSPPVYLLLLDPGRVGDTMFVKDLADRLTGLGSEGPPRICLHGSGPQTEQLLESRGVFVDRGAEEAGAEVHPVSGESDRRLVDRSIREINQRLVALFTHQQVSAVSAQGRDRGLFRLTEGDELVVGSAAWILEMARRSVTPVVSSLARSASDGRGPAREIALSRTAAALVASLQAEVRPVVFTAESGYGIRREGSWVERTAFREVDAEEVRPIYPILERLVGAGLTVWVTSPRGLAAEGGVRATQVGPTAVDARTTNTKGTERVGGTDEDRG